MPIRLADIDTGRQESAIGSFMMFADRMNPGAANDRTAVGDYHAMQYEVQTAEMVANAPGVQIPAVRKTPDPFPLQQGPIDVLNGMTTPGYVQRMEPWYRNLMNDERALTVASTAAPSLTSAESGGRVAALAANAVGDGIAISATAVRSGFTAPTAGPIRLGITPSAAVSADTRLTLVGTDYHDAVITENVMLTTGGGTTQQVTSTFFKTLDSVTASRADTATIDIGGSTTASDRAYVAIFRENDSAALLHGNDFYIQKGRVPNTYRETFLSGLSFNVAEDRATGIPFTWNCAGKRPNTNRFINNLVANDDTGVTSIRTALASIPTVPSEAFTTWQPGLFYRAPGATADSRLPMISSAVSMETNIEFSPTKTGRRFPGGAARRVRTITLNGTMEYKLDDSQLIDDVLANEFLEDTYLELVGAGNSDRFPYKFATYFGRLQFSNTPDATIVDDGLMSRQMGLQASRDATGARPGVYIRIETLNPLPLAAISL